jgi:hypothetical protein
LLVWHFYHSSLSREGGLSTILSRCGRATEQLRQDIRRFTQTNLDLSGLLLVADLSRDAALEAQRNAPCVVLEPGPRLRCGGTINALCLPPDVDAWQRFVPDFKEGFQLVLDEFLGVS